MEDRIYIAIDLKSFYASVECRERGLDPLDTNLVVADISRTDKTICLAVTPSLKSFGMSGRSRLFEVKQRVREVNIERKQHAPGQILSGTSYFFEQSFRNLIYYNLSDARVKRRVPYYVQTRKTGCEKIGTAKCCSYLCR